MEIARQIGDRRGEGNALGNLGTAWADLGESQRAIEFYEQSLAVKHEISDKRGEGNTLWNIALALARLGQHQAAITNTEAALAIFDAIQSPHADMVRHTLAEWRSSSQPLA